MRVSGVVVSHEQPDELAASTRLLLPQVDELVGIANTPDSVGALDVGVELIENEQPLGFAANANAGIRATSGDAVLVANADVAPHPGAVRTLAAFMESREACGIAGPQLIFPDGSWQPSRRLFPTVRGTLVRRTPLRTIRPPLEHQRSHYGLDDRPAEPTRSDWMLGAFLLLRRSMLDEIGGFDERFRLYCEDIDLCYRAARAGWERWYVPAAVVEHAYPAATDAELFTRRTLWHWLGIVRFVHKHPERLRAL